jgi:hypothetical protein
LPRRRGADRTQFVNVLREDDSDWFAGFPAACRESGDRYAARVDRCDVVMAAGYGVRGRTNP